MTTNKKVWLDFVDVTDHILFDNSIREDKTTISQVRATGIGVLILKGKPELLEIIENNRVIESYNLVDFEFVQRINHSYNSVKLYVTPN